MLAAKFDSLREIRANGGGGQGFIPVIQKGHGAGLGANPDFESIGMEVKSCFLGEFSFVIFWGKNFDTDLPRIE